MFYPEQLRFTNDSSRYVNDIAFSNETSNSDTSLATSAFVHKCVNNANYYTKSECDNNYAPKVIKTGVIELREVASAEPDSLVKGTFGEHVFMSGYVYKHNGNDWAESTTNDTQDCICSVKSNGTWREYVGIIISVDSENESLMFASHGDMLFNVNNSTKYNIGDVVLYDGSVVDDDMPITVKIQQSIAGKESGKIHTHTMTPATSSC